MGGFLAAARSSLRAFGGRSTADPVDPAAVTWGHALTAVAVLVVAVTASILLPAGDLIVQLLPIMANLLTVSFAILAVPFLMLAIVAVGTRQNEKLPLLVLFTALSLLVIQATSLALSLFGFNTSAALIGVTAFFVGRAARTVLGVSVGNAILVALLTAAGIFAASFLFFALPDAQGILDGI